MENNDMIEGFDAFSSGFWILTPWVAGSARIGYSYGCVQATCKSGWKWRLKPQGVSDSTRART